MQQEEKVERDLKKMDLNTQNANSLNMEDMQGLHIWYNTKILKDNKSFLYSNSIFFKIIFIGDLMKMGIFKIL